MSNNDQIQSEIDTQVEKTVDGSFDSEKTGEALKEKNENAETSRNDVVQNQVLNDDENKVSAPNGTENESSENHEDEKLSKSEKSSKKLFAKMKNTEKKKAKKQVEEVDFSKLSDDEKYMAIQTEKLVKAKQMKRIFTLAGVCTAFVLAVVVIILTVAPISFRPTFLNSKFDSVKFYAASTNASAAFDRGEAGYKNFSKSLNKSFSQECLAAVFSGNTSKFIVDEKGTTSSSKDGLSTVQGLAGNGAYLVKLSWNEAQVFKKQNGGAYVSNRSSSVWDGKLTFNTAYVSVNSTSGVQDTVIYVVGNYPHTENKEIKDFEDYRILTVTVRANTNVIYNNWNNLVKY